MTPKLKLSEAERNASLSEMLKLCMFGNNLTTVSMQMMLAPTTQAANRQQFGPMLRREGVTHQHH